MSVRFSLRFGARSDGWRGLKGCAEDERGSVVAIACFVFCLGASKVVVCGLTRR